MWKSTITFVTISSILFSASSTSLDPKDPNSIKAYAKSLAESIVKDYYAHRPSNTSAGIFYSLPKDQNGTQIGWSESASIWDALIAYGHVTKDEQFGDVVREALYAQMGPKHDFLPGNGTIEMEDGSTSSVPNDEQSQWALAALSAAEYGFPKPMAGKPAFLSLAENVFRSQVLRWDAKTCNGGLRVFVDDNSKPSFSKNGWANSNFFLLGARLAKLTGKKVYVQWAERQFSWARQSGMIEERGGVWDMMHKDCGVDREISNNVNLGHWIEGAANLYSISMSKKLTDYETWAGNLNTLLKTTKTNPSLYHAPSKPETAPYDLISSSDQSIANTVQYARSLSRTVYNAPFTGNDLYANFTRAANAVAKSCGPATLSRGNGVESKVRMACTADWREPGVVRMHKEDDGTVLSTAAALEVVQGLLWVMPKGYGYGGYNATKPSHTAKSHGPEQTGGGGDGKNGGGGGERPKKPDGPTPNPQPQPQPQQTTSSSNSSSSSTILTSSISSNSSTIPTSSPISLVSPTPTATPTPTSTDAQPSPTSAPPESQPSPTINKGDLSTPTGTSGDESSASLPATSWVVAALAVLFAALMS